jgi:hypothetical protein
VTPLIELLVRETVRRYARLSLPSWHGHCTEVASLAATVAAELGLDADIEYVGSPGRSFMVPGRRLHRPVAPAWHHRCAPPAVPFPEAARTADTPLTGVGKPLSRVQALAPLARSVF